MEIGKAGLQETSILIRHTSLVYTKLQRATIRYIYTVNASCSDSTTCVQEVVYHNVVRLLLRRKWKTFARYIFLYVYLVMACKLKKSNVQCFDQ